MSEAAKAAVGASVLYRPMGRHGQTEQAAIVTRVWDDDTVSLTVFPDFGPPVPEVRCGYEPDGSAVLPDTGAWRWAGDAAQEAEANIPEPTSGNIFPDKGTEKETADAD